MAIKRPIPTHPRGSELTPQWDKWFNLVSTHSVSIATFSVTINPTSVAANTTSEQDVTVAGLGTNDIPLVLIKPTHTAGIGIGNIRVKSAGVLSVTFVNPTIGAVDPPSETYTLVVIRQ